MNTGNRRASESRGIVCRWSGGGLAVLAAVVLTLPSAPAAPAQQAYVKASNTGGFDWFGNSVAVSGDTMVVGAPYEDSNATGVNGTGFDLRTSFQSGAVYIFVRHEATWCQQAYLKPFNTGSNYSFGYSVAVSGNTVVVGAPGEASNATGVNGNGSDNSAQYSGAAYVFVRDGTNWSEQAYLKASNTGVEDNFGASVSLSGDTVVVGAYGEASNATGVNGDQSDNSARSGAAYVFGRSGTTWHQQAYLKASNTGFGDSFGWSVAVSGDTAIIGAPGEASNAIGVNGNQSDDSAISAGAAYVFVRNGTDWSQQAYLKASNTDIPDRYFADGFGYAVAISGDTAVIGARYEDSNSTGVNGIESDNGAKDSGAAYVFVRRGNDWTQQAYLKASNTEADDRFGETVAVSGDTIVIGADEEDSNATGINGSQIVNIAANSGAGYVFVRNGTNWAQQAYLKASNTQSYDYFGNSVALSGDTVVVAAYQEASNATGVNGNQSNDSVSSGAAYVFTGFGHGPRLALVPDSSGGQFIRFKGERDVTYRVQRAGSLDGPWDTLTTLTAPGSGLLEFHDTTAPHGQAFYRTAQP
jgi:FG-GAP repeat